MIPRYSAMNKSSFERVSTALQFVSNLIISNKMHIVQQIDLKICFPTIVTQSTWLKKKTKNCFVRAKLHSEIFKWRHSCLRISFGRFLYPDLELSCSFNGNESKSDEQSTRKIVWMSFLSWLLRPTDGKVLRKWFV